MTGADTQQWLAKLSVFRAELAELAFSMDRRGRAEAADVALMARARIGEICDELQSSLPSSPVSHRSEG